jgi:hypothetical protein
MKRVCLAVAAIAACSGPMFAQDPQWILREGRLAVQVSPSPPVVVGGFETRTTTGRPYSADAVTETTQVLSDGNRIERHTMTRIYRDGQGRTRRENFGSGTTALSISISDPVSRTNYTLNPVTRTAFQSGGAGNWSIISPTIVGGTISGGGGVTAVPGGSGGRARGGGGGAGGDVGGTGAASRGSGGATETTAPAAVARGGGGGGGFGGGRGAAPAANQNTTKEDLGQQTIEGVAAKGTRTTTVIPAGSIGNLQDIKIVSEQWFSDDLQALVLTRHNDPRSGETIYRLRNIVRAEPDASLFTLPADYTLQPRR